jgi:hypothetical protein
VGEPGERNLREACVALPLPKPGAPVIDWVAKLNGVLESTIRSLRALTPPKGHEAQVRQMLALYEQAVAASQALVADVKAGKTPDLGPFQERISSLGARADAIAVDLGATACGA